MAATVRYPSIMTRRSAIILTGGASSRMGADKAAQRPTAGRSWS